MNLDDYYYKYQGKGNSGGGRGGRMNRKGQKNIQVYEDTKKLFLDRRGLFKKERPLDSIVIWKDKEVSTDGPYQNKAVIEVTNEDTLSMTERYIDQDLNPLVLNMASKFTPGGGVRKGSKAQEEDLFRRSNYFMTLDKQSLPKNTYPLKGNTVIYSQNVAVVKDCDYKLLERPFYASFVACPAIKNPDLNSSGKGYAKKVDFELTRDKIEMCYKVGVQFGHDSLVLGALGCGAYNNPPEKVVQIFKQMNEKYGKCFKKIGFAILSSGNNPNFDIFHEYLLSDEHENSVEK